VKTKPQLVNCEEGFLVVVMMMLTEETWKRVNGG
jgi:hypothetical protein